MDDSLQTYDVTETHPTTPNSTGETYTGFKVSFVPYVMAIDIIALLGVIGNILTVFLMTSPVLRRQSFAVYLMFLAVSDALVLITIATEDTTDHIFDVLTIMDSSHIIFCKLWIGIYEFCRLVSPWLLVAMTFDRYIVVAMPLQRVRLSTQKCALVVCISICVVALILISPFIHYLKQIPRKDGYYDCDTDNINIVYYNMTLTTLMNSVLPVCCLLVLTIKTAVALRRISAVMPHRTHTGRSLTDANFLKVTMSLILVSALSTIALVPFAINSVVESVLEITQADLYALHLSGSIWHVLNVVRLLNYAMNFYVLVIFFGHYRIILRSMLTCSKSGGVDDEMSGSEPEDGDQLATIIDVKTIAP